MFVEAQNHSNVTNKQILLECYFDWKVIKRGRKSYFNQPKKLRQLFYIASRKKCSTGYCNFCSNNLGCMFLSCHVHASEWIHTL